jgi:hypothetical protein
MQYAATDEVIEMKNNVIVRLITLFSILLISNPLMSDELCGGGRAENSDAKDRMQCGTAATLAALGITAGPTAYFLNRVSKGVLAKHERPIDLNLLDGSGVLHSQNDDLIRNGDRFTISYELDQANNRKYYIGQWLEERERIERLMIAEQRTVDLERGGVAKRSYDFFTVNSRSFAQQSGLNPDDYRKLSMEQVSQDNSAFTLPDPPENLTAKQRLGFFKQQVEDILKNIEGVKESDVPKYKFAAVILESEALDLVPKAANGRATIEKMNKQLAFVKSLGGKPSHTLRFPKEKVNLRKRLDWHGPVGLGVSVLAALAGIEELIWGHGANFLVEIEVRNERESAILAKELELYRRGRVVPGSAK